MDTNENIVTAALLNGVVKDLNAILNLITVQCEEEMVESVVSDVVEELNSSIVNTLVCKSPSGDAPSESLQTVDTSVKGTSVAAKDGQGDAAILANHVDHALPAKGVKVRRCFCELDGLLDPGVTPQQRAPRRR